MEHLKQSFLYPKEEFSPIPFWFWNDKLTEKELIRQLHDFHKKGVNSFVIHPRIGIPEEIEYLSEEFMFYVTLVVEEAAKLGMKVVLYDEAMYPSGSAHGMVVKKNPAYASKGLKVVELPCTKKVIEIPLLEEGETIISALAVQKISEKEIIADSVQKIKISNQTVVFDTNGKEDWSVLIFIEAYTKGHIRGIHFGEDDGEDNAPASADLLNKEAMQEFIRQTHERYYEVLGNYFGNTIIAMFTDEPCIMGRGDMRGFVPWTGNFLSYYIQKGNREEDLAFLFYEAGNISLRKVKKYEEAVNQKMEESYYEPIFTWCTQHKIAQTGHPHESDDIGFLKFFHIPAQDIVWRWVAPENGLAIEGQHSTMGKCTSDSARHRGMRRNGNECFACCGSDQIEWVFSADDMKWYMDWLFVRGVNLLFPHAFFYSIDGPRRVGERPPDVGPNNIWWPYYNQISDYIKRMSEFMTDGVNQAKVAVLCSAHHLPWKIVKSLYENQIEFNYLENELFVTDQCEIEQEQLKIYKQRYQVILIEEIELLEDDTKRKLEKCIQAGVKVVVLHTDKTEINIEGLVLLKEVENSANVIKELISRDFITTDFVKNLRMTHIVKEDSDFYFLVNEGEEEIHTQVIIDTPGSIEKWDAFLGKISEVDIVNTMSEEQMQIDLSLKRRESVIYRINKEKNPIVKNSKKEIKVQTVPIEGKWKMGKTLDKMEANNTLTPFNEIESYKYFSGTMIYQTEFFYEEKKEVSCVELNLGQVYEIAEIIVNGERLKAALWAPYIFDISQVIKNGSNTLMVEVKNTLANQICNLSRPSGLVGPVELRILT